MIDFMESKDTMLDSYAEGLEKVRGEGESNGKLIIHFI
jgi:hypothetical protein